MKKIKCPLCGKEVKWLSDHLFEQHNITRKNQWCQIIQSRESEIYELEKAK